MCQFCKEYLFSRKKIQYNNSSNTVHTIGMKQFIVPYKQNNIVSITIKHSTLTVTNSKRQTEATEIWETTAIRSNVKYSTGKVIFRMIRVLDVHCFDSNSDPGDFGTDTYRCSYYCSLFACCMCACEINSDHCIHSHNILCVCTK